jgi:GTPase SAR1 family protein
MKNAKDNYQRFQEQKSRLENMLARAEQILRSLQMTAEASKIEALRQKVGSETFKVMVLGRFNVGKSTVINALLGQEILPAYAIPCTAVINEIKYSTTRSAKLYFKNPLPEKIPGEISERARQYLAEHKGQTPPPLDIAVEDLIEYVVIPKSDREQAESIAETPYEKVELYWDLDLCKDGVEIIDSPGLDESSTRTLITFNYLNKADAIIFIMSCESLCSSREMEYIDDNIRSMGHEYLFFANNRINQIREKEKKELIDYGKARLIPKTAFGEKGVFFINALGAIDGRVGNDPMLLEKSGILPMEELLSDFLANKKGKIKILQPAKDFTSALRKALFDEIPFQRSLLSKSYDQIKKDYEEQQPRLNMLETQKRHILENISLRIESASHEIRQELEYQMVTIQENIAGWMNEIVVTTEFKTSSPKPSSQAIIHELVEKFQARLESEQRKWQEIKATPLVNEKGQYIFVDHKDRLEEFFKNLDELKIGLGGLNEEESALRNTSQAERIAALVLSLFLGLGLAPGLIGYKFGFSKEFLKQIGIQVGAIIILLIAGIANPITIIPVILAGFFWGLKDAKEGIVKKLKTAMIDQISKEFRKKSKASVDEMMGTIVSGMENMKATIGLSLDKELSSVRGQVEHILAEMKEDGQSAEKRKAVLSDCEGELKRIDLELNDLILSIAEQV